jgi:hypothetical protein
VARGPDGAAQPGVRRTLRPARDPHDFTLPRGRGNVAATWAP